MALSPFRTKYDQMKAYKSVRYIELRSLRDGGLHRFIDDGPFDNPKKTAQSGRANCLAQMAKRVQDPFNPGDDVPVYVFDGEGPLPKVYDTRINQHVSPPRMTDHFKKVMDHYCAKRNEVAANAERKASEKKAALDQALDEGAARTLQALVQRATASAAPPAPKAAAKKEGAA